MLSPTCALVPRARSSSRTVEQRLRAQQEIRDGIMRRHGGLAQMEALVTISNQYEAYRTICAFKQTVFGLIASATDSMWRMAR